MFNALKIRSKMPYNLFFSVKVKGNVTPTQLENLNFKGFFLIYQDSATFKRFLYWSGKIKVHARHSVVEGENVTVKA